MDSALWAAKTGLEAQQTRMAVTANNLANVNTTGFKRGRVAFEDLLYQNLRQVGADAAPLGTRSRYWCARGRHREDLYPGQPAGDE
jgi:flagellar basal-body rod protein FlgB